MLETESDKFCGSGRCCMVCGDWATGNHYAALTCFGCKGFFQRTIWNDRRYNCKGNQSCEVTKERRGECRYCRYQRCLNAGMRPEAVTASKAEPRRRTKHHKADKEGLPVVSKVQILQPSYSPINVFLEKEAHLDRTFAPHFPQQNLRIPRCVQDHVDALRLELHLCVEWAKQIPSFNELDVASQISLLRAHSAEIVYLQVTERSLDVSGYFVGGQGLKILDVKKVKTKSDILPRVFSELIAPCKRMGVTKEEFIFLKTLVMFDPFASGLSEDGINSVGKFRYQMQLLLENRMQGKSGRIAQLLMILPSLHSIGGHFKDLVREWQVTGQAKIFRLLEDLVVHGTGGCGDCMPMCVYEKSLVSWNTLN